MKFRAADIVAATGGRLVQGADAAPLSGVSTDTRSIEPGELFVAIRGETHDAHRYVGVAAEAGAAALLVERWPLGCPGELPVVLVGDTVRGYGQVAAWWRSRMPARVVGVTGSNGKTTTREMIACLLSALGPTVASIGNHNNHIGVPETLLRIRHWHRFAVVEMGTNHPGEIEYLASLTRPDVALITNVGPAHLEAFGSEYGVQCEKADILTFLAPDGLAVFHAADDDPWSRALAADHHGRMTTFGSGADAVWRAGPVRSGAASIRFRLTGGTGFQPVSTDRLEACPTAPVSFFVPVVGEWQVDNCLAALAVADELGLGLPEAAERLRDFVAPDMRMSLHRVGDLTLILDCYNANPASMRAAIGEVVRRPAERRVAVLGDMLELGGVADAEHHAVGELVGSSPIELLCAVGERAELVARAAVRRGMPEENVFTTNDAAEAADWLCERLHPSDTLLVKASREIRLERVAEAVEVWASQHVPLPAARPTARRGRPVSAAAAAGGTPQPI
jgi:UDP-N-acetylmuramoyl-tripeptide--D-alanyl-D-alanine ligase